MVQLSCQLFDLIGLIGNEPDGFGVGRATGGDAMVIRTVDAGRGAAP